MSMSSNGTGGGEAATPGRVANGARGRRGRRKKKRNIGKNREKQERAVVLAFGPQVGGYRSLRDVAQEMGETVPAVVSLLQEAFRRRLFSVLLHLPAEKIQIEGLAAALKREYAPHLVDVLLVEGVESMLDDLEPDRRRSVHNMVIRSMAQRLAPYLDQLVTAAARRQREAAEPGKPLKPFRLGVAWGRTCHLLASYLRSTPRPVPRLEMEVLPIIGLTSTYNTEPIEANVIAIDIAQAYGAVSAQLPCPAFVPKMLVDVICRQPQVADLLQKMRSVDVVITSMGAILDDGEDGSDIRLSNDPEMNRALAKAARAAGAVGEINYWCFGPQGNVVWTPDRAIGLGLAGLHDIVRDAQSGRMVILVCGGDKRRLEALRIALRAGFASVLVTDTVSARYLLGKITL